MGAAGVPQHPSELALHLPADADPAGILLDPTGGHGVGRFTELTTRDQVQAGRLVPVLREWDVLGGPPTNLLYKGSARGRLSPQPLRPSRAAADRTMSRPG